MPCQPHTLEARTEFQVVGISPAPPGWWVAQKILPTSPVFFEPVAAWVIEQTTITDFEGAVIERHSEVKPLINEEREHAPGYHETALPGCGVMDTPHDVWTVFYSPEPPVGYEPGRLDAIVSDLECMVDMARGVRFPEDDEDDEKPLLTE